MHVLDFGNAAAWPDVHLACRTASFASFASAALLSAVSNDPGITEREVARITHDVLIPHQTGSGFWQRLTAARQASWRRSDNAWRHILGGTIESHSATVARCAPRRGLPLGGVPPRGDPAAPRGGC